MTASTLRLRSRNSCTNMRSSSSRHRLLALSISDLAPPAALEAAATCSNLISSSHTKRRHKRRVRAIQRVYPSLVRGSRRHPRPRRPQQAADSHRGASANGLWGETCTRCQRCVDCNADKPILVTQLKHQAPFITPGVDGCRGVGSVAQPSCSNSSR
jgi:hypothetical protein